jgi:hypothetical protein
MKIKRFLFLAVGLGILLQSCVSSGKLNDSGRLMVRGFVMRPDSSLVGGAIVKSEPPSEYVTSATDGSFTISQGLTVGLYEFIAEFEGYVGRVKTTVQFGKSANMGPVVITLGKTMEMKPLKPGDNRIPPTGPGKKRPGSGN